jgi:hypothetical protein
VSAGAYAKKSDYIEKRGIPHDVYSMLALTLPKPERSNRYSGLIRNNYR